MSSTGRVIIATGKRKTAIARAVIKSGKGRVRINDIPIELYPVEMVRIKMMEPLLLAGERIRNLVDINVNVNGGGVMGQADAVRIAIARGLMAFFTCNDNNEECKKMRSIAEKLERIFVEYDKTMITGDPRRTEPEKYMRYSARRRWQKSYR